MKTNTYHETYDYKPTQTMKSYSAHHCHHQTETLKIVSSSSLNQLTALAFDNLITTVNSGKQRFTNTLLTKWLMRSKAFSLRHGAVEP